MLDLRRFGRLAAVYRAEHGRGLLWFLAIGIGVHLCCWLLVSQLGSGAEGYTRQAQGVLFAAGYAITALLFTARHFAPLGSRESAMTFLMRPGSTFEKALLAFLVIVVGWPLAYTLAFQVVNLPGAWLGDAMRDDLVAKAADATVRSNLRQLDFGPFLPFQPRRDGVGNEPLAWTNIVLVVASLQGLVAAGMLYFRRLAWLKTLVALFVLVILLLPLVAVLGGAEFDRLMLDSTDDAPVVLQVLRWTTWIGVPALLWTGTVFLLRERELH